MASEAPGADPQVGAPSATEPAPRLIAKMYDSGFALAHDTCNGMGTGSDGKIYYVLSSESFEIGAQMYAFDPTTGRIRHLGDLTEACGEKGSKAIVQGLHFLQTD